MGLLRFYFLICCRLSSYYLWELSIKWPNTPSIYSILLPGEQNQIEPEEGLFISGVNNGSEKSKELVFDKTK